jgi:hypothetical protein
MASVWYDFCLCSAPSRHEIKKNTYPSGSYFFVAADRFGTRRMLGV